MKKTYSIFIKLIFIVLFLFLIKNSSYAKGVDGTTIVLNPGHGGSYTGCTNNEKGLVEKDVTLKIAKFLKQELDKYYDVNVILTHDGITFPNNDPGDLAARAMIAINNKADLYVSLHIDDNNDTSIQGATMYITSRTELPKYKAGMTTLAGLILSNLNNIGIQTSPLGIVSNRYCNDRVPKFQYYDGSQADYYGDIRYAMKGDSDGYGLDFRDGSGIPTVLVEHCYMRNSHDVEFLDSDEDLQKIAKADANAIIEYLELRLKEDVVSTITISKNKVNLIKGTSEQITATAGPQTAINKNLQWQSSNGNIALVDASGNITAVGVGKATVTVTSVDNPNVSKQIAVNVEQEEIKFTKDEENILVGKSKKLDVTVSPSWTQSSDIIWESNSSKVTVSQDGTITANEAGQATITLKFVNKSISDTILVNAIQLSDNTFYNVTDKYTLTNNKYISKIGEKVTKQAFINNISISDDLKVEVQTQTNQDYVGTGTKVYIIHKATGTVLDEYTCIIYGDVDGDGEITARDYTFIKNHIMEVKLITDPNMSLASDTDNDKEITARDYTFIKNHMMDVKKINLR